MKPIKEWLLSIEDPVVREKALKNCNERIKNELAEDFSDAITSAFSWRKSPEGHEYWSDMHKWHSILLTNKG